VPKLNFYQVFEKIGVNPKAIRLPETLPEKLPEFV
jgi:hypothetical protein